jgi:hypothetical protein
MAHRASKPSLSISMKGPGEPELSPDGFRLTDDPADREGARNHGVSARRRLAQMAGGPLSGQARLESVFTPQPE